MRQFDRPVLGATSRDYMPQPPGDIQTILHPLESGQLADRFPVVAQLG